MSSATSSKPLRAGTPNAPAAGPDRKVTMPMRSGCCAHAAVAVNSAHKSAARTMRIMMLSSSGNRSLLFRPPVLERRQAVAEPYPGEVVAQPGMVRRREGLRVVQAAGGDVDGLRRVGVLVGERRAAARAEGAAHVFRGSVGVCFSLEELKRALGKGQPGHYR